MSTPLSGCTCLLLPPSISAGSVLVRQGVADTEKAAYSSTSLLGAGWAGWWVPGGLPDCHQQGFIAPVDYCDFIRVQACLQRHTHSHLHMHAWYAYRLRQCAGSRLLVSYHKWVGIHKTRMRMSTDATFRSLSVDRGGVGCSSGGTAGYLLIGVLVVWSLIVPFCMPKYPWHLSITVCENQIKSTYV